MRANRQLVGYLLSIMLGVFYAAIVLSTAFAIGSFLRDTARDYALAKASKEIEIQTQADVAVAKNGNESDHIETVGESAVAERTSDAEDASLPTQPKINILLLGTDERPDESGPARTDTVMLFSLNLERKTAGLISLPRDLWVPIPGYDITTKINTASFNC